jgi:putative ABC transport system permease protein
MAEFSQDLKFAFRQMRKHRAFSIVAILTLALGIGANTAMFSVIYGVLLQPLPYREPSRLVLISEKADKFPILSASYQNYKDWRDQSHSFESFGAVRNLTMTLIGGAEPEQLPAQMATASLFDILGVRPSLGRSFTAEEDKAGGPPVALIGHNLWQRRFSGSEQALGQSITLNNRLYTIIGILPPKFEVLQQSPDVIVAMEPWAATLPDDRSWHPGILPIARLKPGVTLEQARSEMSTIGKRLLQQYAESNIALDVNVNRMQDQMVANIRGALLTLLGAVAFVMLIACGNVANLLLARATSRQREIAIRGAMGAGRWRIFRQLLTESVLLSICGAAVGFLLAFLAMSSLLRLGATTIPGIEKVHINLTVLLFTVLISIAAGVIFGLAPAVHSGRLDLRTALNDNERGGVSKGAKTARGSLVVAEVAMATLLLVGAGLLLRSFDQLSKVNPGFAVDNILIADIPVSPAAYKTPAERMNFFGSLLDRVSTLPGVQSVGATSFLPVSGTGASIHFNIQGRPPKSPTDYIMASYRVASGGYLKTIGISLLQGRWISESDREGSLPVVVINQTMARTYFPNESPLGKHMQLGTVPDPQVPWMEVVGVVGDVKQGLASEAPTEMYVPYRQANEVLPVFMLSVVVKTTTSPLSASADLRSAVHQVNAGQPVVKVRTMEENIQTSISQPRFRTVLLATFAALALIIAAVGIYGVMAYSTTQRTREIGIRLALGSTPERIFQLILTEGLRMAVIGVVVGGIAAVILARYMASMLYKVGAADPVSLGVSGILLIAVALLACYLPARRATTVQVSSVLRDL